MKKYLLILSGMLIVIAISIAVAFFLPPRADEYDFVMLYTSALGVIYRVPIYNTSAIQTLTLAHTQAAPNFQLFPYPYPPWYTLSTFYLGFLPPKVAANAWLLLNIAMLVTAIGLLTSGWKPLWRILAILAGLLFVPALGLLVVGQYSMPVLLGAALFYYAARREDASLTALGLLLMTFKPHIGIFLFPAGFLWLVFAKTPFARRALWMTIFGGLFLATLGFLADPAWPRTYLQALTGYRAIPGVSSCEKCASLSVLLVRLVSGHSNMLQGAGVSLVLALGLGGWLVWRRRALFAEPASLMALSATVTLLIDPYLLNYDYILLLIPLAMLAGKRRALWLGLAYLLPWGTLIMGRDWNIFITLAGILVFGLLVWRKQ
jgi:hypothetical protein